MGFRKSKAELEKAKQIPTIYARIAYRVEVFTNLFNVLSLVQSIEVQTLEKYAPMIVRVMRYIANFFVYLTDTQS